MATTIKYPKYNFNAWNGLMMTVFLYFSTESHGNYLDSLNSPNYSSQNLYVQPPSRHQQQHSLVEDKSNLVPRGRSRGPLLDVSLSQLDRPATPPSHHHAHSRSRSGLDEPADPLGPPRPPPPRPEGWWFVRDYVSKPELRALSFTDKLNFLFFQTYTLAKYLIFFPQKQDILNK